MYFDKSRLPGLSTIELKLPPSEQHGKASQRNPTAANAAPVITNASAIHGVQNFNERRPINIKATPKTKSYLFLRGKSTFLSGDTIITSGSK